MYKKAIRFVLTAVILAAVPMLSGCGMEKTDFPVQFALYNGTYFAVTEDDSNYYFMEGNYLCFLNKKTGETNPVCTRPGCEHQNEPYEKGENRKCNALVLGRSRESPFVQYDNGWIYTFSEDVKQKTAGDGNLDGDEYLVRISADGKKREEVCKIRLTPERQSVTYTPPFLAIHRGYLYIGACGSPREELSTDSVFEVSRLPMDDLTAEPELLFSEHSSCTAFVPIGDHLYWGGSDSTQTLKLFDYDLKTGKLSAVAKNCFLIGTQQGKFVLEEETSLDETNYIPVTEKSFSLYDPETGETSPWLTVPLTEDLVEEDPYPDDWTFYADDQYLYAFNSLDDVMAQTFGQVMRVYDTNGSIVNTKKWDMLSSTYYFITGKERAFLYDSEGIESRLSVINKEEGFSFSRYGWSGMTAMLMESNRLKAE